MLTPPLTFNGFEVRIARPAPVESKEKRTWKERLFTRPFRPFCKLKAVETLIDTVEDGKILRHENQLIMNDKTWRELNAKL